jgi:CRP-like cAMP-binding protein
MHPKEPPKETAYQTGDYILTEGSVCEDLIIVLNGQVEVFRFGKDKVKIPLGIVRSGEYLGEMALISDRPHSANAVALCPTTCLKISTALLEQELSKMPSWFVGLARGLVDKLTKTNEVLRRNNIVDPSLSTAVQAILERQSHGHPLAESGGLKFKK